MASETSRTELRLVLLGKTGSGKSSAGNDILGLQAFQSQNTTDAAISQECQKHRGDVAGRKVVVVDSPDWFTPGCPPEEVRRHVASFVALSTPGPHAFLLCVPVNRPGGDGETAALDALESLLGPAAVGGHTLVLFTFVDELEEGQRLEEHLTTRRPDLLELAERCGERYHALTARGGGGGGEERRKKAVEELLEKVERTSAEEGGEAGYFTCPLYREAEAKVRERQVEMARERREESGGRGGEGEADDDETPAVDEEEMEKVRDEAEKSVSDLNVNVDDIVITPSASLSPSSPPPSFLWALWEKLTGWIWRLPKLVRREALFGSLIGLFVGGPFGGMLGATVGSVATEVGRRKTQKNK